ncbi:MAG: hypothetical protein NTV81_02445, partial [Candidatus Komeilibacteria bacterium]|nr:hypothetical protein [Candidatus Komeilibacteria bacterium]
METAILLRTLGRHLAAGHIPSPYQEAEKILAWFYGLSWNDFIIGLTAGSLPPLTKSQPRQLTNLAAKRSKHWPLAYLLGEKYFANRRFLMKAGVFIPRPDSER